MNLFYKPKIGVLGDCIPFFSNGRYHVFYLCDSRDPDAYGIGSDWQHISTTDFVTFEDHGVALPKGNMAEQDHTVATGCAYTDDHGQHHIFYTGINPYLRNDAHHEQALLHATSNDLIQWTKVRDQVWYADESIYERHDWRDPFIFKHPQSGQYMMIIAARLKQGPQNSRGCTALLTSDDLTHWTVQPPFYAPGRYHGHECPDWFKLGNYYYLVFSEYTTRTTTRYVMSRAPDGPWTAPADNLFDNRAFYAAKSASDGDRRFLFGWNPSKVGNSDGGEWQWGGCLTIHEIVQDAGGTLSVRMPPEIESAFGHRSPVSLDRVGPGWEPRGNGAIVVTPYAYAMALGPQMPTTHLLEAELSLERNTGTAGILLRMDEEGDTGYFLRLNLAGQRLEFGKVGGYRSWYVDHMPELDRPLQFGVGERLRIKVIVDKTAVVAYVNDRVAMSGRMYSNPLGRCGLFADGTELFVHRFEFRQLKA